MPLMGSGSQVFNQVSLIGSLEQRQGSSVHSEIACVCGLPVPNTGKGRQNESLLCPRKTHATFDVLHACMHCIRSSHAAVSRVTAGARA